MTEVWHKFIYFLSHAAIEDIVVLLLGLPLIAYSIFVIFAFYYKSKPVKGPDKWYLYILIGYLSSFLWIWLSYSSLFKSYQYLIFLPINLSFWIGPFIFFFVKSKLYDNFRSKGKDLKHFILPISHISFYVFAFLMPIEKKVSLYFGNYQDFYKPIELASFGLIYFLYLYFAYRFIKHEQWSITHNKSREFLIKIEWIRRFIKILWTGSWVYLCFGLLYVLNNFFLKIHFKNNYLELMSLLTFMFSMGWLGLHAVLMKVLPKN